MYSIYISAARIVLVVSPGFPAAQGKQTVTDTDKNAGFPVLNSFYYLAPLWFVLETFFWPNFRAGMVFGPGLLGIAAFYSAEAGIGAALWFKLPYASAFALLENIVYLVFVMKFILYAPVDAALAVTNDAPGMEEFSRTYAAALPGMLYSMYHVVTRIRKHLAGLRTG